MTSWWPWSGSAMTPNRKLPRGPERPVAPNISQRVGRSHAGAWRLLESASVSGLTAGCRQGLISVCAQPRRATLSHWWPLHAWFPTWRGRLSSDAASSIVLDRWSKLLAAPCGGHHEWQPEYRRPPWPQPGPRHRPRSGLCDTNQVAGGIAERAVAGAPGLRRRLLEDLGTGCPDLLEGCVEIV